MVPRIWKPALSCTRCSYPNDIDYKFCQRCGHGKEVRARVATPAHVAIDNPRIESRLKELEILRSSKPYQRQKDSLQRQLESFLDSLPSAKSIATASPADVVNFLIWRDQFGTTTSHSRSCSDRASVNGKCSCHKGLSAGTIRNNIGKLITIFKHNGRSSPWNDELNLGNPATHVSVKEYHSLVLEEQTIARTFPKQAVPFFMDKLVSLTSFLRNCMQQPGVKPSQLYILARDLAFFSIDFFSGDRGSDLGRVLVSDVLTTPANNAFIFNQVFGKTLRGNGSNVFAIKEIPGSSVCPVANLKCYLSVSKAAGINLNPGFLFRSTDHHGYVTDKPFIGTAVANRLRKHLTALSINAGETMHSFRSGCSITLSLLGVPYSTIAEHVGWKSVNTAIHYSQCDKVLTMNDASSILASSMQNPTFSATSTAEILGKEFRERNFLNGFKKLFDS